MSIREELYGIADPEYRDFHTKMVPGSFEVLGVKMPVLKEMSKRICKDDWRSFLEQSVKYHEEQVLNALVIATAGMTIDERLLLTKKFVPTIGDWGVCDVFCSMFKAKRTEKKKLWEYCLELIDTDDEFMMRVSAVMMRYRFLDDEHIEEVLHLLSVKNHPGYYYKMGAAWTLSACYLIYPERTENALFSESLDKEIRNKAIQKISDSFRVSEDDKEKLKTRKKDL